MQKKGIIAILSAVVLMVAASISLVLAFGPRVSAASVGTLQGREMFKINENTGMLTGLSAEGKEYINQFSQLNVVIPEGVKSVKGTPSYGYMSIFDDRSWDNAKKIISIDLPSSLETIGPGAFFYCQNLKSIEIPDSVTIIDEYAFTVTGLVSITIPGRVTSIGARAFQECKSLKYIEIPNSVERIGANTFYRCSSLTSITIPNNVSYVDEDAFSRSSLTLINCECSEEYANEHWSANWKNECDAEVVWDYVYVPTYNVTFNVNGGSTVDSQTVSENEYATVPVSNPTREGYDFVRWYTDDENVAFDFANTPITADMTINALWQIKTYTITFDSNGGSVVDEQRKEYGSYLARPDDPTLENCIFMGWYLNNGLYNFNNSVKADMTLQAKWGHTVTFDANGGSSVDSQVVIDGECAYSRLTYREHYNFVGWYFNDAEYNFTTPVTANVTLTAQWEIEHCWVYFDSNGGSVVNAQNVAYGEIPTEPTEPTREDYFFVGWYKIISNGAGNGNYDVAEYEFDTPITEETTLTAVWKKKCRIIFNGGSEELMVTRIVGEGDLLEKPNLSREGYTLESWATDPDGVVTYNFSEPVTGDLTLYAQWTENPTEPETPTEQIENNSVVANNNKNNAGLIAGIAGGIGAAVLTAAAALTVVVIKKRK